MIRCVLGKEEALLVAANARGLILLTVVDQDLIHQLNHLVHTFVLLGSTQVEVLLLIDGLTLGREMMVGTATVLLKAGILTLQLLVLGLNNLLLLALSELIVLHHEVVA